MAIWIMVQLAFVPIALMCAAAALVALGSGYKDEIPQQPQIDFWFYFMGMLGALNLAEAIAQSSGGTFGENMLGGFLIVWPIAIIVVIIRLLTKRQEAHR